MAEGIKQGRPLSLRFFRNGYKLSGPVDVFIKLARYVTPPDSSHILLLPLHYLFAYNTALIRFYFLYFILLGNS